MKKASVLLIGFFILLTSNSSAFINELTGQVTEQKTNSPIAGAKVQLLKNGQTTDYSSATDFEGKFSIRNIPEGSYDIVIFHPGYLKKQLKSVEIKTIRTININRTQLAMEPISPVFITKKGSLRINDLSHLKPDGVIPLQPSQYLPLHGFYLGLKENSDQFRRSYKKKDLNFFRHLKIALKNDYQLDFAQDSSAAFGLILISPARSSTGRLKQAMATFFHKNTGGEVSTLIYNAQLLNDSSFAKRFAEEVSTILSQVLAGIDEPRIEARKISQQDIAAGNFGGNGRVTGQILEKKTKKPIIGARVRLLLADGTSAKMGAITNDKGKFVVLNVPPGTYQVEFSYGPTYTRQLIKDIKVEANRTYETGVIQLAERVIEPDTVLHIR